MSETAVIKLKRADTPRISSKENVNILKHEVSMNRKCQTKDHRLTHGTARK